MSLLNWRMLLLVTPARDNLKVRSCTPRNAREMCGWWPCIILCGCRTSQKPVKKPKGHLRDLCGDPNCRLYCVNCGRPQPVGAYRYVSWFTLFMIPVFPYRITQPFAACEFCKHPLDFTAVQRLCRRCGAYRGDGEADRSFCPACGAATHESETTAEAALARSTVEARGKER